LKTGATLNLKFTLKNSGARDGDEVAQVYFRHVKSAVSQPQMALCGFTRLHLKSGESSEAAVSVPVDRFRYWDTEGKRYIVEPGEYELLIGAASDDIRLRTTFKIED
jgi:beta-glucosidase